MGNINFAVELARKKAGQHPKWMDTIGKIHYNVHKGDCEAVIEIYKGLGLTEQEALLASTSHGTLPDSRGAFFYLNFGFPDRKTAKKLLERAGYSDGEIADAFIEMAEENGKDAPIPCSLLYELAGKNEIAEQKAVEGIIEGLSIAHKTSYGESETTKRIAHEAAVFIRGKYPVSDKIDG